MKLSDELPDTLRCCLPQVPVSALGLPVLGNIYIYCSGITKVMACISQGPSEICHPPCALCKTELLNLARPTDINVVNY